MPRRKRETPKKKAMTSADRQAKWRLSHSKVNDVLSPPTLLLACHPKGKIGLDELEGSAAKTMELYNKLVAIITGWLDKLDTSTLSTADGFTAFKLLAPSLESLAVLRAKIGEQRAAEARDVTAQMQTNLEASGKREAPRIEQTLELLRSRFAGNTSQKPNGHR
jgi:hypothetical protein